MIPLSRSIFTRSIIFLKFMCPQNGPNAGLPCLVHVSAALTASDSGSSWRSLVFGDSFITGNCCLHCEACEMGKICFRFLCTVNTFTNL